MSEPPAFVFVTVALGAYKWIGGLLGIMTALGIVVGAGLIGDQVLGWLRVWFLQPPPSDPIDPPG